MIQLFIFLTADFTNRIIYGNGTGLVSYVLLSFLVTLRRCQFMSNGEDDDTLIACIFGTPIRLLLPIVRSDYLFLLSPEADSALGAADPALIVLCFGLILVPAAYSGGPEPIRPQAIRIDADYAAWLSEEQVE